MIVEVSQYVAVASFSEAWIEILSIFIQTAVLASPPSRRRGLKSCLVEALVQTYLVASFSEAWIEINHLLHVIRPQTCRLLLGGVD